MFFIFFIGFECIFSSTFTLEKISFENFVEFYLPPVEIDNAYVEIKI
jgi:hypothetical protein